MPRLRLIGRWPALCDVILLLALMTLGAIFVARYAEVTSRNSSRDYPVVSMTFSDEDEPGKYPWVSDGTGSIAELRQQTVDELLSRIPDTRPPVCRRRRYHSFTSENSRPTDVGIDSVVYPLLKV